MNFIIMFMASPEYVRNPYLRAKMVEVLNCWMPRRRLLLSLSRLIHVLLTPLSFPFMLSFLSIVSPAFCSGSSATASLFEGHQLSLQYLVKNLLKLYVDIEFTGSHTQVSPWLIFSSVLQEVAIFAGICLFHMFLYLSVLLSRAFFADLLCFRLLSHMDV